MVSSSDAARASVMISGTSAGQSTDGDGHSRALRQNAECGWHGQQRAHLCSPPPALLPPCPAFGGVRFTFGLSLLRSCSSVFGPVSEKSGDVFG